MADRNIHIDIFSPRGRLFSGEVSHAELPGELGPFAIYPMHAPLISSLTKGTVRCFGVDGKEETIAISGGFAEVHDDRVTVCAEQEPEQAVARTSAATGNGNEEIKR